MTIHSEHPFMPPESDRSPIRRLRGRLTAGVTLWTAAGGARPAGLTVSSMMVADGDPGRLLALLDPDSDLWAAAETTGRVAVSWLSYEQRRLADAFAGVAPAPGGPFKLAEWQDTDWGPVLEGASTWAGCRLVEDATREVGWGVLVEAVAEHIELGEEQEPALAHRRGRYLRID